METAWLEGVISVEAALQAGSRPVYGVYVREGKWDGGVRRVLVAAEACGVPVHRVSASFIAEKATGSTHGGVLAEVGERRFVPLAALLAAERPFLAMLDGVEDPYNFGQAVRALYAAGAHGLVIRARNWLPVAGILARASAGAFERIPIGITETAESAASFFRQHGLTIACATQSDSIPLYQADLTQSLFLFIGGEKRGVTRSFASLADLRLKIPYAREFGQALGTTVATAVLAFEIMRQRGKNSV